MQPGLPTVQGALASAIGRLSGENVLPQGSGRTDAGVHALAQVATFATASPIPVENWLRALNDMLPASIRVLEVAEAAPEFHARKSAQAKTYRYRILSRSDLSAVSGTLRVALSVSVGRIGDGRRRGRGRGGARFHIVRGGRSGAGGAHGGRREGNGEHARSAMCARFFRRHGRATATNGFTRCAAADSFITWCGTWSAHFCWWGREP